MFDPDQLAQPVDSQSPCGPDCEYDGDFLALTQAIAGKPEQQFGDTVIAAVEPDWRAVEQMASTLLARTKDLRVLSCLTQAATRLHGVSGFAAGVGLMQRLCEQYWDEVHPRMVIDGEADPYLRMNALATLSDGTGSYSGGSEIMRALRLALLANGALPITVRDVEAAGVNDSSARYTGTQLASILADAVAGGSDAVAAFERAAGSVEALVALIEERVASGDQPDFSALRSLIKTVAGAIARARPGAHDPAQGEDATGTTEGQDVPEAGARVASVIAGEIRSRDDVRRSLQRVCDYLERHEPSSPSSLFARRAERMLGMGFLDIMQELAPDAMSHLQTLTGAAPSNL
ncbi:MAG: type VI secretion system protein TssA [Rhodoferax sp.]